MTHPETDADLRQRVRDKMDVGIHTRAWPTVYDIETATGKELDRVASFYNLQRKDLA